MIETTEARTEVASNGEGPDARRALLAQLLRERATRERRAPLSHAQERLWFVERLAPGNGAYHMSTTLRLEGDLDVARLERALTMVAQRHQVLLSRIELSEEGPVQVIDPTQGLPLERVDLRGMPLEQAERHAQRLAIELGQRPFDLEQGPLARATALRVHEQTTLLAITLHHVVCDGWSIALFIREVGHCYTHETAEGLGSLTLQYDDVAALERQRLAGPEGDALQAYWTDRLGGLSPVDHFTPDQPRPPTQTYNGASTTFELPPALVRRVEALAQETRSTPFMVLTAAQATLMARYSGAKEVAIGTPVANRPDTRTEHLIGCFVNTLVLRIPVRDDDTFHALLRRVRQEALAAYEHQNFPYARLVEALQTTRELSGASLFQVFLAVQNTPSASVQLAGVEAKPIPLDYGTAPFDLSLSISQDAEAWVGTIQYNTDLFLPATAERLAEHYVAVLAAALEAPDRSLARLQWLPEAEQDALRAWNQTDTPLREQSISEQLNRQSVRTPDAPALSVGDATWTYAELEAQSNQLAHWMVEREIGPGSRVAVYLDRSADLVVALLAILKAGAAYVPLDPAYPQARVKQVLDGASPALVITRADISSTLPGTTQQVLDLEAARQDIGAQPTSSPEEGVGLDRLAYVTYTSGSTGTPKGVMVTHRNVANFFCGMDDRLDGGEGDTWLATTSVSFDISVLELLWTLSRGFHVVLYSPPSVGRGAQGLQPTQRSTRPLAFSLFYFADEARGQENPYKLLLEGARFADTHGFEAVWTPERHFHSFGGLYPSPAVAGAAIAAITESVQIRAGSAVLPLHHPVRIAEEWAMVDNLSGGRVGLSLASGWHQHDFILAPDNYANRREVLFEGLDTVRRLWRGDAVTFDGVEGAPVDVQVMPRPVQPELPVWITAAGSPETFRRAGEVGAGILTHLLGQSREELAEKITLYRKAWRDAGHPPEKARVTLMLHTFVGEDADEVRAQVEGPFRQYLRGSIGLVKSLAPEAHKADVQQNLTDQDMEILLDLAVERYIESSSLIGTIDECAARAEDFRALGVDEVACLIDFGVEPEAVLESLTALDTVHQRTKRTVETPAPEARPTRAWSLVELARHHGITHLQTTPSTAASFVEDPEVVEALGTLRNWYVGGEALSSALAESLQRTFPDTVLVNMYGPTETTVWSSTHHLKGAEHPVPLGYPIANTQLHVLDAAGEQVPVGVPGELYIGGEGVTRGYLQLPARTAERFVPDPWASAPGRRLYRTGDRVRRLPDGTLVFMGRFDSQVKVRGFRVELQEIEAHMRAHPTVRDAVAVVSGTGVGAHVQAYYLLERSTSPGPDARGVDAATDEAPNPAASASLLQSYTLPNGLDVAHQHDHITSGLYTEIFGDETYLRHGITIEDGDCVVDVGANIGMFSLYAHYAAQEVRVYAFEPIPPTFACLNENFARHGIDGGAFQRGVARAAGQDTFTFYPNSSGLSGRFADPDRDRAIARYIVEAELKQEAGSSEAVELASDDIELALDERFVTETFECTLQTVSDLIAAQGIEQIDLLKIDAERSEYEVLMGIKATDWARIKQVVAEVDTEELLEQCRSLLESHGFECSADRYVEIGREGGASRYVYLLYAAADGLQLGAQAHKGMGDMGGTLPPLPRFLEERLPAYMVPSALHVVEAFPLTPNGKVDRGRLASMATSPKASQPYAPPEGNLEQQISAIWARVLEVEKVGVEDNFFERGGTSLLMALVHRDVRSSLNPDITLVDLFRYPTVRSLAGFLEGGASDTLPQDAILQRAQRQRQARRRRRRA
ncbi:MAG: MupA/Atu3671 family FMN-dependent luciferase-like monooxygenase [Bacteroidota bacterium]